MIYKIKTLKRKWMNYPKGFEPKEKVAFYTNNFVTYGKFVNEHTVSMYQIEFKLVLLKDVPPLRIYHSRHKPFIRNIYFLSVLLFPISILSTIVISTVAFVWLYIILKTFNFFKKGFA